MGLHYEQDAFEKTTPENLGGGWPEQMQKAKYQKEFLILHVIKIHVPNSELHPGKSSYTAIKIPI